MDQHTRTTDKTYSRSGKFRYILDIVVINKNIETLVIAYILNY